MPTAGPHSTHSFLDLPVALKRQVDRVCREFERAGPAARIEDYLPRVGPELRPVLVNELVGVELERRRDAGHPPDPAAYLARFPDYGPAVRAAFRATAGPEVGSTLGKYRLTGVLGRGGMGVVYEAEDPLIGRPVAIKVLPDRLLADPAARQRLLQEARLAGQLLHPNVVTLFEVGEADGVMFLVLERVAGGSAADRLAAAGPLDWRVAALIAADVCRGLAAIHAAGFLHLDLKPANILLPPRAADESAAGTKPSGAAVVAKLTDFSLAITGDADGGGVAAGTPAYMSPEQRAGGTLSRRTDVYGAGAALFALLVGRAPFAGGTVTEVVAAQVRDPAPDPRAANPAVPEAVARVVRRAMAPDPADRHPSADDLLADLQAVLGPPARRRPGRRLASAVAALAVGVAAVVSGVFAPIAPVAPPSPAGPAAPPADWTGWEPLFDGHDLAGWQKVPFTNVRTEGEMSVVRVDGGPALRASGEGVVAVETVRAYGNYHLKFEFRWGDHRPPNPLASVRYHCTGPIGTKGTHGFEILPDKPGGYQRNNDRLKLDVGKVVGGRVEPQEAAGRVLDPTPAPPTPPGGWTRGDLVCVDDWSVHAVNGVPVLVLAGSKKSGETRDSPLSRGRIRLQSIRGEIFFRNVEVRPVTALPPEFQPRAGG